MIFVNSFPALPTKGSACMSSSLPGPSPINISFESVFPCPNTTFVRPWVARGHCVHCAYCCLSVSSCCCLERSELVAFFC